jgi:hypothetical protein
VCADLVKSHDIFVGELKDDTVVVIDREGVEAIQWSDQFVSFKKGIKRIRTEEFFFSFG